MFSAGKRDGAYTLFYRINVVIYFLITHRIKTLFYIYAENKKPLKNEWLPFRILGEHANRYRGKYSFTSAAKLLPLL